MNWAHSGSAKPRVAVHKFSSCDGCQLAFLNLGEDLLRLAEVVDLVHFAEAGLFSPDAEAELAFVEGSVSTPEDLERIARIREHSHLLVAIGACAVSGGVQALRNNAIGADWKAQLYPHPDTVFSLDCSTPIASHVKVDFELCGCPVTSQQVLAVINACLLGAAPADNTDKVCSECKRRGLPCVMVSQGAPCMGPVTRAGCSALCPSVGRDCYGCFGASDAANTDALAAQFAALGLTPDEIARRFQTINSQAPVFLAAADKARMKRHE